MYKIAILTTVANFDLFEKTNHLFDNEFDRYVIDGREGMYGIYSILYMMKKFKNLSYDYIIMVDEDFILKSNTALHRLITNMNKNDITFTGVRDGGVISHRNYNPFCINTFFSILNLNKVKKIWNAKEMLSHQRIKKGEFYLDEVLKDRYDEISLYEPYYCFYLWLLRKGEKVMYLNSKCLNTTDNITNVVYNQDELIGYHSWYARSYGVNIENTQRIDKLFLLINVSERQKKKYVLWKDPIFKYIMYLKKIGRKVKMKLV